MVTYEGHIGHVGCTLPFLVFWENTDAVRNEETGDEGGTDFAAGLKEKAEQLRSDYNSLIEETTPIVDLREECDMSNEGLKTTRKLLLLRSQSLDKHVNKLKTFAKKLDDFKAPEEVACNRLAMRL